MQCFRHSTDPTGLQVSLVIQLSLGNEKVAVEGSLVPLFYNLPNLWVTNGPLAHIKGVRKPTCDLA